MADWALAQCEREEYAFATVSRTGGANTKGAYTQITAATNFPYSAISLQLGADGGGGQCYLIDLAIGASGSEILIVPNILLDSMRQLGTGMGFDLPIHIPSGSRISARLQEVGGAGTRLVNVGLSGRAGGANIPPPCSGGIVSYGANTATSNGILVDQGATANTFGAWAQIAASTSQNHQGVIALLGVNQSTGTMGGFYDFQIGIGASGSEIVVGEFNSPSFTNANRMQVNSYEVAAQVPVGTRLAMRCQCTVATSTDRIATAVILGY